jgi:hypothetical protein
MKPEFTVTVSMEVKIYLFQLDILTKIKKCPYICKIIIYFKHNIPATIFGHSCGHPVGGTLQRMLLSLPYLNCPMLGRRLFRKSVSAGYGLFLHVFF